MTYGHLAKEFADEALVILAEWHRTGVAPRWRDPRKLTAAIIAKEAIDAIQDSHHDHLERG